MIFSLVTDAFSDMSRMSSSFLDLMWERYDVTA